MDIRRLTTEDAELALQAIIALKITPGAPPAELPPAYVRRFLSRPDNVLIVATDDHRPVGFLLAYLLDRVDRQRQMVLFYEIEVAESHRRRGIGVDGRTSEVAVS